MGPFADRSLSYSLLVFQDANITTSQQGDPSILYANLNRANVEAWTSSVNDDSISAAKRLEILLWYLHSPHEIGSQVHGRTGKDDRILEHQNGWIWLQGSAEAAK